MAANVNADAFIPQIWDTSVIRTLEDNLIARKICKAVPSIRAKGAGDTVYFNGLADPTVDAYTGSITYESLVSSQIALLIDQQNKYAFKVTDVEAVMSNVDLKGSQAARAAYQLKKKVDTYLFGASTSPIVAEAGHTATADATCDATTIFSDIAVLSRILEEQNVEDGDKWLILPPWAKEHLKCAGVKFSINEGTNGTGGMSWTDFNGFDVYISNNLYNSGTAAAPVTTLLAGSYNSVVYEDVLLKSRAMELESSFEVGVSGLHVFGAKVVKPNEIVKMICTYSANSTV